MDALSVLANSIEASGGPGLIVAAGLLARVVVGIEVAAHGLLPTVEFKARLALGPPDHLPVRLRRAVVLTSHPGRLHRGCQLRSDSRWWWKIAEAPAA